MRLSNFNHFRIDISRAGSGKAPGSHYDCRVFGNSKVNPYYGWVPLLAAEFLPWALSQTIGSTHVPKPNSRGIILRYDVTDSQFVIVCHATIRPWQSPGNQVAYESILWCHSRWASLASNPRPKAIGASRSIREPHSLRALFLVASNKQKTCSSRTITWVFTIMV